MKLRSGIGAGILALAALAALVVLAYVLLARPYSFYGSLLDPPLPAFNITLTDAAGQPFRLDDQRGRVVLLFFGYTYCPDVCPTTLADFQFIERQLAGQGLADRVRMVFITVDPERDTPSQLKAHLGLFSPNIIGLSGSLAELEEVYRAYGVARVVQPVSGGQGYLVDHTARVYVIDSAGSLRLTFPFGLDKHHMLNDITYLVNE